MNLPRTKSRGSPSGEKCNFGKLCPSYHGRVKRRWNRVLAAFAVLVVGTQLSIIGIALIELENSSDSHARETSSKPNPFQPFRSSMDLGEGYYDRLRQHHQNRHQNLPQQIPPKQQPRPRTQAHHNSKASKETGTTPERDVIHIVHTRFMQHQGNMTTLGVARLKQFLAFCLPTMVHQTTQNFLWIIKVDPFLEDHPESNAKVLEPLLEAVKQHSNENIYVVASNFNFNMEGHGGSWRDGQEGEELLSSNTSSANKNPIGTPFPTRARVYTGDMARLKRAHDLREALPVLETRLDADDGLNRKYLERVQTIALDRFLGPEVENDLEAHAIGRPQQNDTIPWVSPPKPRWLYWCIMTQIEWHSEIYSNSDETNNSSSSATAATMNDAGGAGNSITPDYWEIRNKEKIYYGNPERGYVVPIANDNFCITPGLTVGYGVGTTNTHETVPRYMHTALYPKLYDKYKFCHAENDKTKPHKGACLERMGGIRKFPDGRSTYVIHALRSRALTSAGMDGVGNSDARNGKSTTATTEAMQQIPNKSSTTRGAASEEDETKKKTEDTIWKVLGHNFAIDLSEVKRTQKYLATHRAEIALENILGQCSTGHSCKDKAKERLRKIAESQLAQ